MLTFFFSHSRPSLHATSDVSAFLSKIICFRFFVQHFDINISDEGIFEQAEKSFTELQEKVANAANQCTIS